MKFLLASVLFAISVTTINAYCNVCQESNQVACHGLNHYSLCVDGVPTAYYKTCPGDYICTGGELICYPPNGDNVASCPLAENDELMREGLQCGICDEDKVFACLSETSYSFCFGQESIVAKPGDLVMDCPPNTVCNINYKADFCYDNTLAKVSIK
ncbi:uncharacterized protein LOC133338544 [Musca vetustissima]|uniref:uncharacterized protein LOC133338544 n=1 Tax=Musca vetustissima TaxID=27455 RepID=UPI002AB70733|nr:uncharacterized protein LOC133338544 [Musca vetustissima]